LNLSRFFSTVSYSSLSHLLLHNEEVGNSFRGIHPPVNTNSRWCFSIAPTETCNSSIQCSMIYFKQKVCQFFKMKKTYSYRDWSLRYSYIFILVFVLVTTFGIICQFRVGGTFLSGCYCSFCMILEYLDPVCLERRWHKGPAPLLGPGPFECPYLCGYIKSAPHNPITYSRNNVFYVSWYWEYADSHSICTGLKIYCRPVFICCSIANFQYINLWYGNSSTDLWLDTSTEITKLTNRSINPCTKGKKYL
jgi:hypothetical protein